MKKLIALLLCMILAVGLFAGCNNTTEPNGDDTTGSAGDSNVVTIGVPMSANVTDWYDNEYTKWVEEQTGYTIEFVEFASNASDYKSQISTMTAGGMELPDMLWNFKLGTSTYEGYGEDGYLIDLKPYFDDKEKSATFWERMSELDEDYQDLMLRKMESDDGAIYGYPSIQTSVVDTMDYQVWINTTWLDALGLEKPTNRDELVEVLRAFKNDDPNGNGQPDEIPMIGAPGTQGGDVINWIINMFVYNDDQTYFNVDENGKLYVASMTDEYREALKFIRSLCDEGLLNPVSFNAAKADMLTVTSPGEGDPRAGIWVGHLTICYEAGHEGMYNYEALPLWSTALMKENANDISCFITEDAENPDACWEILMCLTSKEGAVRMRYGVPGVHWDWAEEGQVSHVGIPAEIVMYTDVWGTQGNDSWKAIEGTILPYAEAENCAMPENTDDWSKYKLDLVVAQRESYAYAEENYNPDESLVCPILVLTTEEQEETSYERTDCSSTIKRAIADFCVGTQDPNNDEHWNNYLAQLESYGIQTWLEQAQEVYERTIAE